MKVSQITTVHPGTENRIAFKEGLALHSAGYKVSLIAPGPKFTGPYVHHMIHPSSKRALRPLTGYLQVWRALRRVQPDVVHAHDPELIPLCLVYRAAFGAKFVFDVHENLAAQVKSKHYLNSITRPVAWLLARTLEKLADSYADAIVVAERELSPIFVHNQRIVPVRNFPWVDEDGDDFSSRPHERANPVLGYVGAIAIDRGFRVMQSVVQRSRHQPILRLAGRFQPESLETEVGRLTERAGHIEPSEIPDFLAAIDVGLCLLRPEPNYVNAKSTKIYEYMMAGKPFLYSNFPAWEAEHGSEYGIPVDPNNVDEICRKLDGLLDDPQRQAEMGLKGRRRVIEEYSFQVEAGTLVDLYEELVGSPGDSVE